MARAACASFLDVGATPTSVHGDVRCSRARETATIRFAYAEAIVRCSDAHDAMSTLPTPFSIPFVVPAGPRLHALLDMLPAAAYTCDRAGRITHFNRMATLLWGRTPRLDDARDRFCGSYRLHAVDGTPIPHEDCWIALAQRDGRDYDGREIVVERPDGTRRTALAHASPTYDELGGIDGAVNVMVDITAQKEAEAALRETNRRKDAFLATLAHELRNPLAPLRCAVPILRRTQHDPEAAPVLEMVERQVDHLVRLVDDLLEASRITRGRLNLRRQAVDITSVLGLAVETARPRIESLSHTLSIAPLDAPAWIDADPVRMAQALANVLDNAARFTAPGGRIEVALDRGAGWVEIGVRDTGAGIPRDALPHVFDLFVQEERIDNGQQPGLGVGLALVKTLVELHGGTVRAHSDGPGRGSEFVVRLPVADGPQADEGAASQAEARGGGETRQRVLDVDDNRDAAQSLAMLVELLGNDVSVAFDGAEALGRAPVFQPTIVLLDLSMPGMSGFEVASRLRQQADLAPLRLVALSGRSEDEYRRRSAAAGFDDHLVKPIDLPTLQRVLGSGGQAA
jgi:PAS domain S-box-containing protein